MFKALQGDHTTRSHIDLPAGSQEPPRITLTTVYRNLHNLVDEGEDPYPPPGGAGSPIDPETNRHDHFVASDAVEWSTCSSRRVDPVDLSSSREARLHRHDAHLTVHGMLSGLCRRRQTSEVPARPAGERTVEMMPDPTPPYRVPRFCPDCRESFSPRSAASASALESALRRPARDDHHARGRAAQSGHQQRARDGDQRRMSSLLAGRGRAPATPGSRLKSNCGLTHQRREQMSTEAKRPFMHTPPAAGRTATGGRIS